MQLPYILPTTNTNTNTMAASEHKRARSATSSPEPGPAPGPAPPGADGGSTSDSDSDVGPMPAPATAQGAQGQPSKKRKVLAHQTTYLAHLPSAERYFKSLMHRDTINFATLTPGTNFLITASVDGHVKFWKKSAEAGMGVEFVKHYRAHLSPIIAVSVSADGGMYASVAADGSVKVFDVVNFGMLQPLVHLKELGLLTAGKDLINMIQLDYTPRTCCWVHRKGRAESILAISEQGANTIRLYDGRGDKTPIAIVDKVHRQPCHVMAVSGPPTPSLHALLTR